MDKNNRLDKRNEASEFNNNIKKEIDGEEFFNDLKETLHNTVLNTSILLKNILSILESTVKDEEIKKDSKNIIFSITEELNLTIKRTEEKLGTYFQNQKTEEE